MDKNEKALLYIKIQKAELISVDVFDTLLFRKTNSPEIIFDIVGEHFSIPEYRQIRMSAQNSVSGKLYAEHGYPHANMDEIYEELNENSGIKKNWNDIKEYEIRLEKDSIVGNGEMLEVLEYAKGLGKRIVATTDMYLFASDIEDMLLSNGFTCISHVYCSADERAAKFNKELFEVLSQKEEVPYENILHIGDKERDDSLFPGEYGIDTFIYQKSVDLEKVENTLCSDIDNGLYKILADEKKGFWYNLGVEVGGPIYMGLYLWLRDVLKDQSKKMYFLSRDGYTLYKICKELGYKNIEYLQTSRRALLLASITEIDDRAIELLPPYTFGQTVGEILDWLCVEKNEVKHLEEAGFKNFDEIITNENISDFKQLYVLDKDVFLNRAALERDNAKAYFESIGFLNEDGYCFDCGWQGSSQELIEHFMESINASAKHPFYYVGIKNSEKSIRQLYRRHYSTFLFDFYKNYVIQYDVNRNVVMYELFFSASHPSVFYYEKDGRVVFEETERETAKDLLMNGIVDFVKSGLFFVQKYHIQFEGDVCVGHLNRLINCPTVEEATQIGNLKDVDGFVRQNEKDKFLAFISEDQIDDYRAEEIYWIQGLLKRNDVSERVKKEASNKLGLPYPQKEHEYHLEAQQDIADYYRWINNVEKTQIRELNHNTVFSIVIPVYNVTDIHLSACIDSILNQHYPHFELLLIDDNSLWENVRPTLKKYENEEKIKVIYRSVNGGISEATNDGINAATGEFIAFMDCDDLLEPDALYCFAEMIDEHPEYDFIYSDEDKITEDGKIRHMPVFKPNWSPDMFFEIMYTNHLAMYRTDIVKQLGGLKTAYNGSQDYEFTMRFLQKTDNHRVGHIAKILYHWRERKESIAYSMESKSYAVRSVQKTKEDYISKKAINAHLEPIVGMGQYRLVYDPIGNPLVSIIIPSKDHPTMLEQCVNSIVDFTEYRNYEIVVVDNGSSDENRDIVEKIREKYDFKYVYKKEEFNFSAMCNRGAAYAEGEYLLFLNDDIEIIQPDWLGRMIGQAQQDHVGAVGAKLFYPKSTVIQHCGVSQYDYGPVHVNLGANDVFQLSNVQSNWLIVNCSAVTGACMLVATKKFHEVSDFDESFPIAYNDVDFCYRLLEAGYYNVQKNDVVAYHHESFSRGNDFSSKEKMMRLGKDYIQLYNSSSFVGEIDPFVNENLTGWTGRLKIKKEYDELNLMDLSGCVEDSGAITVIDGIEATYRTRIFGWSVLQEGDRTDNPDRMLVLQDCAGNTYGCHTLSVERVDVLKHFNNDERYRFCGFESVLRFDDLRMDLAEYRVGIMYVLLDGKKVVSWGEKSNLLPYRNDFHPVKHYEKLHSNELYLGDNVLRWSLDDCIYDEKSECITLRGFVFKENSIHHQYLKKIVLKNDSGELCAFDTNDEERIDVAVAFPNETSLYDTGFIVWIYEGMLDKDREYDVYLRIENRFDESDIWDISTNKRLGWNGKRHTIR